MTKETVLKAFFASLMDGVEITCEFGTNNSQLKKNER